jgi:hypothetical protein
LFYEEGCKSYAPISITLNIDTLKPLSIVESSCHTLVAGNFVYLETLIFLILLSLQGETASGDGPVPEDGLDHEHPRLLRTCPCPLHVSQVRGLSSPSSCLSGEGPVLALFMSLR